MKKVTKNIIFPAELVNASIVQVLSKQRETVQGGVQDNLNLPVYRLLPAKFDAFQFVPTSIENKKPYVESLKRVLAQASHNNLDNFHINQGFTIVGPNSRLYFQCSHQGSHVVFFTTSELIPNKDLRLKWETKCPSCVELISSNSQQGQETIQSHGHFPSSSRNDSVSSRSVSSPCISNQIPGPSGIVTSSSTQHNIGYVFKQIEEEMKIILQTALNDCVNSDKPYEKAMLLRNEICVKIANAYTDSITSSQRHQTNIVQTANQNISTLHSNLSIRANTAVLQAQEALYRHQERMEQRNEEQLEQIRHERGTEENQGADEVDRTRVEEEELIEQDEWMGQDEELEHLGEGKAPEVQGSQQLNDKNRNYPPLRQKSTKNNNSNPKAPKAGIKNYFKAI